jgi:hypothetical protein
MCLALAREPTILQLRAAATRLGQRMWVRVALPTSGHAGEPITGLDVVARWTSVLPDAAAVSRIRLAR